MLCSQKR